MMDQRDRLIYLCHRIPFPPNKGDKIRSFNILKYLAPRYEVYLACLVDDRSDLQYVDCLRSYAKDIAWDVINTRRQLMPALISLVMRKPLSVGYFYSPRVQRQVDDWLRSYKFRAILAYSSPMAQYVKLVQNVRRIMDFCDVDSAKWHQLAERSLPPRSLCFELESRRLAKYEGQIALTWDASIVITPTEAELLRSVCPSVVPHVVPNGVDLDFYDDSVSEQHASGCRLHTPYLVFTGAMDYRPNVDSVRWFVKEVFPTIQAYSEDISFYIVGSNPTPGVRKLANDSDRVYVTGYVNDVRPYVKNAEIFVAPMRIARGMQTKILEAMACGTPVVTTKAAAEGLGALDGKEVMVAESADEFSHRTLFLLGDGQARKELVAAAKRLLRKRFVWEENLKSFDVLIQAGELSHEKASPRSTFLG